MSLKLRKWSPAEDTQLVSCVNEYLAMELNPDYRAISKKISFRSPKQCRERYENSLQPDVKRGEWNFEETLALAKLMTTHGQNWAEIKDHLTTRTYNAIKKKGRKILGEIVDRNCIPKGHNAKAVSCWTQVETRRLIQLHLNQELEKKQDYLFLALNLKSGRSEAEIERQLIEHCICQTCFDLNRRVNDHDSSASEMTTFKEKWSLWKASEIVASMESEGFEKTAFKGTRRASTLSNATSATMESETSYGSKRRRITQDSYQECLTELELPARELSDDMLFDFNLKLEMSPIFDYTGFPNLDLQLSPLGSIELDSTFGNVENIGEGGWSPIVKQELAEIDERERDFDLSFLLPQ